MTKLRKIIVALLTVAIFCSLFIVVFAVANSITEDMNTQSILNPFEYAQAPDGLYVFLYYGQSPYMSLEIDTSECVVGRLYVYNSLTESVTEISEQSVTDYAYAINVLYYVTTEQKVYKTDYSGTNHEYLYQSVQGNIDNLNSYFDALYFIEDQSSVILLDVANKTTQEIWTHENLSWVIMLNADQLVATTTEEDNYLYDIPTNTATIISEVEATNLITVAVKGSSSNNTRSTTPNFAAMVTQENNVSFPVPGYNVVDYNSYPTFDRPVSWFHNNGLEGCNGGSNCKYYGGSNQCEGFARYAHDVYAHMENYNIQNRNDWDDDKCIVTFDYPRLTTIAEYANEDPSLDLKLFLSAADVANFFAPLKTGAYVRYGKYDDNDRNDGMHSIVLVAKDDLGIWVYECNQKYDGVSGHGCGVFLQYYTYENLTKYEYILHYVNHSYSDNWGYRDKDYHSKNCSGCVGHVKKEHTSISASYINTSSHRATFNCCGGEVHTVPHTNVSTKLVSRTQHQTTYNCCNHSLSPVAHTGSVTYAEISSSKHRVKYTCCSSYVTEVHMFEYNANNQRECILCGYISNSLLNIENEELN